MSLIYFLHQITYFDNPILSEIAIFLTSDTWILQSGNITLQRNLESQPFVFRITLLLTL